MEIADVARLSLAGRVLLGPDSKVDIVLERVSLGDDLGGENEMDSNGRFVLGDLGDMTGSLALINTLDSDNVLGILAREDFGLHAFSMELDNHLVGDEVLVDKAEFGGIKVVLKLETDPGRVGEDNVPPDYVSFSSSDLLGHMGHRCGSNGDVSSLISSSDGGRPKHNLCRVEPGLDVDLTRDQFTVVNQIVRVSAGKGVVVVGAMEDLGSFAVDYVEIKGCIGEKDLGVNVEGEVVA